MNLLTLFWRLIVVALLGLNVTCTSLHAADTPLGKGVLLVATRQLDATSFSRTVILITKYDSQGAMGVAINRRSRQPLKNFFPDLPDKTGGLELYLGGPVDSSTLFVLARPHPGQNWTSVLDETGFSGGDNAYRYLLQRDPNDSTTEVRVYAGYAGWASGQLLSEIQRGDWRVVSGDQQIIFPREPDDLWIQLSKIPTEISI